MKYLYCIMVLAVSTCMWSCQDDKQEEGQPTIVTEPDDWHLDLVEDDPEPEWEMPESGIYQFSMTAIVKLSDFLAQYADEEDELSAFVGNECRGMVKMQEYNGEKRFLLYIRGNSAETQKVSLKYYSAKNKKQYVCNDLFDFVQNGMYGKMSAPAVPPFEESGKYPEVMTVYVALPDALPFELRSQDLFAAFVADECRAVAEPLETEEGRTLYRFEVRGKSEESGAVYFQYYSMQQSGIYRSAEAINFVDGTVEGSSEQPLSIAFEAVTHN